MTTDPLPPESVPEPSGAVARPKRRKRYAGKNPRRFEEKYKELNPVQYPETLQKVMASGKTPAGMHRPVMVREVLDVLLPKAGETGVDCTLGYGGHATELWRAIQPGGRLFAFDVDPLELPKTEARLREALDPGDSLVVTPGNFAGLPKVLAAHEISGVDFLLADLGVSSMQLDDPSRGFSYKTDSPLDLRMNPRKGMPVSLLLQKIGEDALEDLLRENSDEPRAREISREIVERRSSKPVLTTRDLTDAVRSALAGPNQKVSEDTLRPTLQRVFQALRIAVNEEFSALEMLLRVLPSCLNPGGRVAILTFHSGEDRRVKQAFEAGWRSGLYASICEEVIRPGAEECHSNPRASSTKLRWAVRSQRTGPTQPEDLSRGQWLDHPLVEFRTSGIHGTGAFARSAIPEGEHVIEYLGERINKVESAKRCHDNNQYIFTLDDESDLDGSVAWNPARFINHSCHPNCEALNEDGHIWIVTQRPVKEGEELSFNYGFDLDTFEDYPCRCGAPNCVGYIVAEEYRDALLKRLAAKAGAGKPGDGSGQQ